MTVFRKTIGCLMLVSLGVGPLWCAQDGGRKPALIRDTDQAEGKDEIEAQKPKEYNPIQSEKSLKIGDYYFKRKNYKAAIQRYLEAIDYQPSRTEAYESLGRAYERNGEQDKALEVYKNYLSKNPESPKVADFRNKIEKLEKK